MIFFILFCLLIVKCSSSEDYCEIKVDINFVYDGSGSIGMKSNNIFNRTFFDENFNKMKSISQKLIEKLIVGPEKSRISFSSFSTTSIAGIGFDNGSSDQIVILDRLSKFYHKDAAGTYLNRHLVNINNIIFNSNVRKNRPGLVIVFTDGIPTDDPKNIIKTMNNANIKFIFIPINQRDISVFLKFTHISNVIAAADFDKLEEKIEEIRDTICSYDCEYSNWERVGSCVGEKCGGPGLQLFERKLLSSSSNGLKCDKLSKKENCKRECENCIVTWDDWSECDSTVCTVEGKKTRTQKIDNPDNCTFPEKLESETQMCSVPCKDCVYSDWIAGECSARECGAIGTQRRMRTMIESGNTGLPCDKTIEEISCKRECENCIVTWDDWSECDSTVCDAEGRMRRVQRLIVSSECDATSNPNLKEEYKVCTKICENKKSIIPIIAISSAGVIGALIALGAGAYLYSKYGKKGNSTFSNENDFDTTKSDKNPFFTESETTMRNPLYE